MGPKAAASKVTSIRATAGVAAARAFSPSERLLITRLHGVVAPDQLLRVLNDRQILDRGSSVQPFTIEQLHEEIRQQQMSAEPADWAGLRRILAKARASGLTQQVTPQLLEDFGVIFSLSPAQMTRLTDIFVTHRDRQPKSSGASAGDAR